MPRNEHEDYTDDDLRIQVYRAQRLARAVLLSAQADAIAVTARDVRKYSKTLGKNQTPDHDLVAKIRNAEHAVAWLAGDHRRRLRHEAWLRAEQCDEWARGVQAPGETLSDIRQRVTAHLRSQKLTTE